MLVKGARENKVSLTIRKLWNISHESHNASETYPPVHHFLTEMHTPVHISVTGIFYDFSHRPIVKYISISVVTNSFNLFLSRMTPRSHSNVAYRMQSIRLTKMFGKIKKPWISQFKNYIEVFKTHNHKAYNFRFINWFRLDLFLISNEMSSFTGRMFFSWCPCIKTHCIFYYLPMTCSFTQIQHFSFLFNSF